MQRNTVVAVGLAVLVVVGAFLLARTSNATIGVEGGTSYKPALVAVSDMVDGVSYPVQHTFKCVVPGSGGVEGRDWHSTNRWVKNQLSYDTYEVDGRIYQALSLVDNRSGVPLGHVRFRHELINVGTGPHLEGKDYMKTLINGRPATIQREVLFVEFNGTLEPQARPYPPCGTPRS